MKIGWIGFGNKGLELVNSLIYFGHEVYGYNRTYTKLSYAIERGLIPVETIDELVSSVDVIFTMLDSSNSVYDVYCRKEGILESCGKHDKKIVCIDLTTSSPKLAKFLANNDIGVEFLDAPFIFQKNIEDDSIFYYYAVGGKKHIFDKYKNLFNCLGSKVFYVGEAGSGQVTKKASELSLLSSNLAISEMITYANEKKLDLNKLFSAVNNGAGSSLLLTECFEKIVNKDYKLDYSNKQAIISVESILKENPKTIFALTKIIYGILKKMELNDSILSMNEFYKENENEK